MKLRTRKFLAGLLSLGLLLQAASPLSALAAETASGGPTLTVTVKETAFTLHGTDDGVQFEDVAGSAGQTKWNENGLPAVSYSTAEGFKFGAFSGAGNAVEIVGTGNEDVVIKSTGESYAVQGHLTMDNVGGVTIVKGNGYNAALQNGADITCSGTLKIQNNHNGPMSQADFAVQGNLNAEAGSVEVLGTILGDAILEVGGGSVTLKCTNGTSVTNKLSVTGANDVTVEAVSQDGAIGNSGDIDHNNPNANIADKGKLVLNNCTGTVLVANSYGRGKAIYASEANTEPLNVTGQNAVYRVCNDGRSWQVSTNPQKECKEYHYLKIELGGQAQPTTHTLTLKYAEAYEGETKLVGTAGENGTTTYTVENGKELTIKAVAPDETQQWMFKGWTGSNKTDKEITVTVNKNMTLTANWVKEIPEPDEGVNYGIKVTIGNNPPIEVTSENCGHILGVGNDKLTYDPDTHTLTGTGSFGKMKVEITDDLEDKVDVVLSNANGAVVNGSLTVTGAQDVKVTGVSSTALITGDATITCAGDILMDNTGSGNVLGYGDHGNLDVQSAQNVTIHGEGRTGTDEDGNNYTIYGRAEIECSGNVEITSQNGGAVWDPVVITKAANVTITANQRAVWDSRSYLDSSINCSGEVKITSKNAAALHDGKLTITGATDVTISGKRDEGATIGGDAEITCSGDVVLENKGTGAVVESKLVYTQSPAKGYEVKTGKNAESATVAYTDEEGTTSYTVTNTETDTETNPVPSYISITAVGTPPVVPGDDDFTGGDSGAGGAVAAVLVGGAAVWGGYEITTRVILHNILPEGAEIPANRGQLALLVWNTAGRPEPVNTPAFADVADADTAKAAQWCVEQGLLDAKSESSFKPEGWMPKFKTIEVWEKAFPKQ